METSISSKTVSQWTICGDPESLSLEITKNTEPKLASKEKMKIEQTKNNPMQAQDTYFKYFPSQKMAHTKATVRKRAMMGIKTLLQPLQH